MKHTVISGTVKLKYADMFDAAQSSAGGQHVEKYII